MKSLSFIFVFALMGLPLQSFGSSSPLLVFDYGNQICREKLIVYDDGTVVHNRSCYNGKTQLDSTTLTLAEVGGLESLISQAAVGTFMKSPFQVTLGSASGYLRGFVSDSPVDLRNYDRTISTGIKTINQSTAARSVEAFILQKWSVNLPPLN